MAVLKKKVSGLLNLNHDYIFGAYIFCMYEALHLLTESELSMTDTADPTSSSDSCVSWGLGQKSNLDRVRETLCFCFIKDACRVTDFVF